MEPIIKSFFLGGFRRANPVSRFRESDPSSISKSLLSAWAVRRKKAGSHSAECYKKKGLEDRGEDFATGDLIFFRSAFLGLDVLCRVSCEAQRGTIVAMAEPDQTIHHISKARLAHSAICDMKYNRRYSRAANV
jgi:hypothetical protein